MENLIRDLRFAVRTMSKRKAITAAAVVCLALAIGATTVVYSLVDGVLLRPLPYQDPDRLFLVWNQFPNQGFPRANLSGAEFTDLVEQSQQFETLVGIIPWFYNLTEGDNPERLVASRVSSQTFRMLGASAAVGRTFDLDEEKRGVSVAVISHSLWKRRFDSDPAIAGRTIQLDQRPYTVIGVMSETFRFMELDTDIWVPLVINPQVPRYLRGVQVAGRLKPNVSQAQAQAELDAIASRFAETFPGMYPPGAGYGITMVSLNEVIVGNFRSTLVALLGAVVLVLLIGCTNVANLLLSQATSREREMSVRAAMGAGRWRLLRQMLTESVLLGLVGGALGVLLARWGLAMVKNRQAAAIPRLHQIEIDTRILLFALVASVLTGVIFGLVPAFRAARANLFGVLKEGGKTSADSKSHPVRNALVVGQIVLALVVLIGTGLMMRSFQQLSDVEPGFRTDQVLTMQMVLSGQYAGPQQQAIFADRLLKGVQEIPGVRNAGLVTNLPLGVIDTNAEIAVEDRPQEPGQANVKISWRSATEGYFETMGIPLIQGRTFSAFDRHDSEPVAIIDRDTAERLWPDQQAIDKRLKLVGTGPDVWRKVVGVVGTVRNRDLRATSNEHIYVPLPQLPSVVISLAAQTSGPPIDMVPAIREAARAIDPMQPLARAKTTGQLVEESLSQPRFNRLLFALFGGAALILAAIGVYGVTAYSVAQRKRELGLRMALGAQPADNLKMVMFQALRLAAVGVVVGLGCAWALSKVLASFLGDLVHGIEVLDLATFLTVPLGLLVLSAASSLIPALRATHVNPIESLRDD